MRPEKLLVSAAAPDTLPNRLAGTIRAVAYRGDASDYEIELNDSGQRLRATLPNDADTAAFVAGLPVWVGFAQDSAVVLTA